MRKLPAVLFLAASSLLMTADHSAASDSTRHSHTTSAAHPATISLTGRWVVKADFNGTPIYLSLQLEQQADKLTGNLDGDKLEGTVTGNNFHFLAKDEHGGTEEAKGTIVPSSPSGSTLSGTIVFTRGDDPSHPESHSLTATLAVHRPANASAPRRHDFTPTVFYRQFSPNNAPVLTINPGDTVHTTTVDAGGADENGVTRVLGGNPETGPFFIETAVPGDTLVVHLIRLRLNRDWAGSDDFLVPRAVDSDLAVKMKDAGKGIRWHLDLAKGVATPEKPAEHLAHYSVPLRPMLGCVAVAPQPAQAAPGTGDSGRYGGNMDFNEIIEGATIYLPVNVPGALLYVGDGHAAQGDGELNGNALETSMDVEFGVEIIPDKNQRPARRIRHAHHGRRPRWLDRRRLPPRHLQHGAVARRRLQAHCFRSRPGPGHRRRIPAAEYKVTEAADRNAGVALKINKDRLKPLTTTK